MDGIGWMDPPALTRSLRKHLQSVHQTEGPKDSFSFYRRLLLLRGTTHTVAAVTINHRTGPTIQFSPRLAKPFRLIDLWHP